MSLASGTRLGPYEIQSAIGAGGMGEVYKARDTRLERTVAIKVLPPDVSADPDPSMNSGSARAKSRAERRARFEREAKTVAALNHPHICTLHDVGDHDGAMFLVMEHLAGQTLAERLEKGPLPLEQALTIATEIADALSAAHRQGVIHRDLKPANVMLTKSGAKLLDFGLAKLTGHGERPAAAFAVSAAPTQAATLTGQGVIVGTLQYMAPEQLEGKPPDARTDLWAMGAIIYEMVTGKRAFDGASAVSVMGAILEREPAPIVSLQPLTPTAVERLVAACLAKDPEERLQSAHDVMRQLQWISASSEVRDGSAAAQPALVRLGRARWLVVGVIGGFAAAGGLASLYVRSADRPAGQAAVVSRLLMSVRPADGLNDGDLMKGRLSRTAVALTPDGRSLVFVGAHAGTRQLYQRPLDRLEATPIAGTEDATAPFFSPDGKWIGFWVGDELRKVPLAGGPPVTIGRATLPFGATWTDDSIILGRLEGGLVRIPASGGSPEDLTRPDAARGEVSHRLPHACAASDLVLFTVTRTRSPDWGAAQVAAYSMRTRSRVNLVDGGADARCSPSDHLLYVHDGVLIAAPFDRLRARLTGAPAGLVPDVMQSAYGSFSAMDTGAAQFDVAENGTLAYVTGGVVPQNQHSLVWVDRAGRTSPVPLGAKAPTAIIQARISPDGGRIALGTIGRNMSVWVYDIEREVLSRLTTEGRNSTPAWTPDGRRITYRGAVTGPDGIFWRPADSSGASERIATAPSNLVPACWSPDGKTLFYYQVGAAGVAATELWSIEQGSRRPPTKVVADAHGVSGAQLSPDGQWLAYASNRSGQWEVYVEPYGRAGGRLQVSGGGGLFPTWRADGHELFYIVSTSQAGTAAPLTMMSVAVTTRPTLSTGPPTPLFDGTYLTTSPARSFDVSPDGRRFLFVEAKDLELPEPSSIVLVQNWFEELKAKGAPAR